ncbi:MAG: hypothetical protein MUC52_00945 [Candidatus Omnitrophica bacterium]|jgi:hypothetical protein|nr:hypothetical protein [Candidatus Omnitrophota bacterium]
MSIIKSKPGMKSSAGEAIIFWLLFWLALGFWTIGFFSLLQILGLLDKYPTLGLMAKTVAVFAPPLNFVSIVSLYLVLPAYLLTKCIMWIARKIWRKK